MAKKYINWNPSSDIYTKPGEIEVHEKVYSNISKNDSFRSHEGRLEAIRQAEKKIGKGISGVILDIGAGNGYASVDLAKRTAVKQVHSLECNIPAVDKVIRKNYEKNTIPEEKYELILGSFNDIKNKNYYDYAISLGALHHSSNLAKTMREIYSSMKPGAHLFAYEPYMDSLTSNKVFTDKERSSKKVQGLIEWKESNRDDHFFRKCEYLTSFHHSGFDIVDFKQLSTGKVMNASIILKKPATTYGATPHSWFQSGMN
jgi:SAM-dependent methyltransferase